MWKTKLNVGYSFTLFPSLFFYQCWQWRCETRSYVWWSSLPESRTFLYTLTQTHKGVLHCSPAACPVYTVSLLPPETIKEYIGQSIIRHEENIFIAKKTCTNTNQKQFESNKHNGTTWLCTWTRTYVQKQHWVDRVVRTTITSKPDTIHKIRNVPGGAHSTESLMARTRINTRKGYLWDSAQFLKVHWSKCRNILLHILGPSFRERKYKDALAVRGRVHRLSTPSYR